MIGLRRLVPDRASRGGAKRRASARAVKPYVAMVFPTGEPEPKPRDQATPPSLVMPLADLTAHVLSAD